MIEQSITVYAWVPSSADSGLPPNAVHAGHDTDGAPIFVGRAFHEGDQLPAKVIPSKQVAYVAYGGQEIVKHQFEVSQNSNSLRQSKTIISFVDQSDTNWNWFYLDAIGQR